jgi:hypothetical protein
MIRQCRIIGSWSEDRFVGTSPTTGTVSLHWWPWRDPWSPATKGPLYLRFSRRPKSPAALAALLVPVPFSLQATDYGNILPGSCKARTHDWEGGRQPYGAPAFLTPLHSLTGPVGQPFVSRLGGHRFAPPGCTHPSGTDLLLAMSHYKGCNY